MSYVDGFVVPVPIANKQAYIDMAATAAPIFREHGALQVVEGWGDNLQPGKTTDFFMATKAEEGENVVFSWIVWPSKAIRDEAWQKIMADDRMQPPAEMPFDGKRMFWGSFETIIEEGGR